MAVYEYDSQNQELHRIAGGTLYADCPIGSYIPFGGTVIPTGWLLCNGQAVSRTDYADLFAVIGTAYGSGDGSTTFNIPDLREAVPKGAGLTGKSNNHLDADGLAVGEFLDDRVQDLQFNMSPEGPSASSFVYGTDTSGLTHLSNVCKSSARLGATTEVKSVGSNYIIKAKQIGAPADFVDAIDNVIEEKFSYSTSEVNTGKKWIDGKDVYSKTIVIDYPTNSIDITSLNISTIVSINGFIKNDIQWIIPLGFNDGTNNANVYWDLNNTTLTIITTATGQRVITIEYTKS